jgi:flagellum-specific peptidoglycan hydrolase FlgJ
LLAPRYANALKQTTPIAQITEIKKSGYATDPSYVSKIQPLITSFQAQIIALNSKKSSIGKVISLSSIGMGLMAILFYFYKKSRK